MNGPTLTDTIATEFDTEEFDTSLPTGATERLAAVVEGAVGELRSQISSDDRLEELLWSDAGAQVLKENDTDQRADPEPVTQQSIVEPFLKALGYHDIAPEAGDFSSTRGMKADYSIPLDGERNIESNRLLIEVEPLNKRLHQTNHGLGQVKDWLERDKFEADFGIATDGVRWILIKYDRDTYSFDIIKEMNLQSVFIAAFENQTGRNLSLDKWMDDPAEDDLAEFYLAFAFDNFVSIASEARSVIRRKRSQVTDDFYQKYVRLVFGSTEEGEFSGRSLVGNGIIQPDNADDDDVRLFAVGLMNRLIFVKFLEDKELTDKDLLRDLLEEYQSNDVGITFYKSYLEPLFFGVLNERPDEREPRLQQESSVYSEVPYLNGGLFRPTVYKNDSLLDTDFDVSNSVLESVIALLEQYTFSADGDPGDLDPSVLGNVFEKTINHITSGSDNRKKQLGAYYTPDEITRFTAERTVRSTLQERFKEVLVNEWDLQEGEVDAYNNIFDLIEGLSDTNIGLIDDLLEEIDGFRALDPACGSGHFLTSVLSEIVSIRKALYEKHDESPPEWQLRKQTVIQNVYGVDIEEPAVEISKLRLWLSIITAVDNHTASDYDEEELALPNVVFNIQNGNSLVGFTDLIETSEDGEQTRLSSWEEDSVRDLYGEIIDEISLHKQAETTEDAYEHMEKVEELKDNYRGELNEKILLDYQDAGADDISLSNIEELSPFHWVLEFPQVYEDGGFDIVVGNPPYVRIYRGILDEVNLEYWRNRFQSAHMKFDLYVLFMELSIDLAKPGGMISLIIPDKFMFAPYGEPLREKILDETQICSILDVREESVFEGVSVKNVVPVLRKGPRSTDEFPILERVDNSLEVTREHAHTLIESEQGKTIRLSKTKKDAEISDRIEEQSIRFDSIYYSNWGLRTGTKELTQEYVVESDDSPLAKPMIRGKNVVDRYQLKPPEEYIIYEKEALYNPMFEELFENPKIIFRKISGEGLMATVDEQGLYCFSTLIPSVNIQSVSHIDRKGIPEETVECTQYTNPYYTLTIVNSTLMNWYYQKNLSDDLSIVPSHIQQLPIAKVDFATSDSTLLQELKDGYSKCLNQQSISPCEEQFDSVLDNGATATIHDFLAFLGKNMSEYNTELMSLDLDLEAYVDEPNEGRKLANLGVFEFRTETENTILDEKSDSRDKLRAGRAEINRDGRDVTISLTARYKPSNGSSKETDQWGYVETDPLPALDVETTSEVEARLLEEFVPFAVNKGGGFAGFRENATKTKSLRNRLLELEVPHLGKVENSLRTYLEAVDSAEELKHNISITDSLIDHIVYRLYSLSKDEIEYIK